MRGPVVRLTTAHAETLLEQLLETARIRGWAIRAVAIMADHMHIVVGVPGDPNPSKLLGDFKSWGTRCLSRRFGAPASGTWWTERGSRRKLGDDQAIHGAVRYALYDQPDPLITWSPETGRHSGPPPRTTASVEA